MLDEDFHCDIDEFTEYYSLLCLNDVRERIVHAYVIKINDDVAGYVTLAMAHIRPDATKAIEAKGINENVPALLISHLAVDETYQGHGVGTALLDFVFLYLIPNLKNRAGCRYVMLNPRDDEGVRQFYINYGFDYYDNFKSDKNSDACLYDLKSLPN
ncbi:MAG: GNAT family N-acetyltransferase [Nitrosarchaeum sp.]|nr:GNAT family N-acetyltransferase [Nitrosarchaeum sp.]